MPPLQQPSSLFWSVSARHRVSSLGIPLNVGIVRTHSLPREMLRNQNAANHQLRFELIRVKPRRP